MINIRFLFILFQKMELKPSDICFSQAEINNVFDKNSCHPYKNLGETGCGWWWLGRRGRNRMEVGSTTTYAISVYHH
jgi:hypothetical protein